MGWLRTLGYVLLGALVTVVGMFIPLVRLVAPALGGVVAGYLYDEDVVGGATVGLGVAAVSISVFVVFGAVLFGLLVLLGVAATDPEAANSAFGLGGVIALIWVVVVPALTLVAAPVGGALGGYLAERSDEDEGERVADAGDAAASWPGVEEADDGETAGDAADARADGAAAAREVGSGRQGDGETATPSTSDTDDGGDADGSERAGFAFEDGDPDEFEWQE